MFLDSDFNVIGSPNRSASNPIATTKTNAAAPATAALALCQKLAVENNRLRAIADVQKAKAERLSVAMCKAIGVTPPATAATATQPNQVEVKSVVIGNKRERNLIDGLAKAMIKRQSHA